MTSARDPTFGDLPLPLMRLVDERCGRFEAAWKDGGARPTIEELLSGLTAAERTAVLAGLIPLEADYRRLRGERPAAGEYLDRFPSLDCGWLEQVLAGTGDPPTEVAPPGTWSAPARTAATTEDVCRRIVAEKLATDAELEEVGRDRTADELLRELVARGMLTTYQEKVLAAGELQPLSLGDYVIHDLLGRGGMGAVFLAVHRRMKRRVALKVMHHALADDPRVLRRFRREAEVAARLNHPNVVTAYDAGEDRGVAYLATEYVPGTDLYRLVEEQGPLPVERAVRFTAQAARGLAYAHSRGVVHRDVKPSNLIVGTGETVRVLDVGLARLLEVAEASADRTAPGVVLGTAAYMAPEQSGEPGDVDERADIYSLGCTLHFLLTGRPVFEAGGPLEQIFAHRDRPVPALRDRRPDVPAGLDRLFRAMLAKKPADRPRTMDDVIAGLEACAADSGISIAPPQSRPQPRRRWIAAGVVAAFAAVVIIAVTRRRDPAPVTPDTSEPVTVAAVANAPADAVPLADVPFADAADYQRQWAAKLGLPVEFENEIGMTFRLVPPGRFWMGSTPPEIAYWKTGARNALIAASIDSERRRQVVIERAFYIGVTEVTVGQFRRFVNLDKTAPFKTLAERPDLDIPGYGLVNGEWVRRQGYKWDDAGPEFRLTDEHPAINICWDDAITCGRRLTALTGGKWIYRLPSEAEWEYACRAGSDGRWCWGNDERLLDLYAVYGPQSQNRMRPVRERRLPNAFGLFDMHGNHAEWCEDRGEGAAVDSPDERAMRGGRFLDTPRNIRSASRNWHHRRVPLGGFRIVAAIPNR